MEVAAAYMEAISCEEAGSSESLACLFVGDLGSERHEASTALNDAEQREAARLQALAQDQFSADYWRMVRWTLNAARPDNLVVTVGALTLAETAFGAECAWSDQEHMVVCGGASGGYFGGGTMWAGTYVDDLSLGRLLEEDRLLAHEAKHGDQYATMGATLFLVSYLASGAVAGATERDMGCNYFEDWADFEDGKYQCRGHMRSNSRSLHVQSSSWPGAAPNRLRCRFCSNCSQMALFTASWPCASVTESRLRR